MTAEGQPSLLLWSAKVNEHTVEQYDGALVTTFRYRGRDLGCVSKDDALWMNNQLAAQLRLGSGYMIQVNANRRETGGFPEALPDCHPVLDTINRSRQEIFRGGHFHTDYYLTITYLPPGKRTEKLKSWLSGERKAKNKVEELERLAAKRLEEFERKVEDFASGFRTHFESVERLGLREMPGEDWQDEGQLRYFRECLTGEDAPFAEPLRKIYLNLLFAAEIEGERIAGKHTRIIAIDAYPVASRPRLFADFECLPFACRWTSRMILFDPEASRRIHNRNRQDWLSNRRGMLAAALNREGQTDGNALKMAKDAEDAMTLALGGDVQFGAYNQHVILRSKSIEELDEQQEFIRQRYHGCGFQVRVESLNADEALRGTLPGHGYWNIRMTVGCHTRHFVDLMPTSTPFTGLEFNPCQYMPKHQPPIFRAATDGATPFNFHPHIGDVGHQFVVGPTRAGKSAWLAYQAASWLALVPDAQVIVFDKKASIRTLCLACDGQFLDFGASNGPRLCPLADLEEKEDKAAAEKWLDYIAHLNNCQIQHKERPALTEAIDSLANRPRERRSMTDLLPMLNYKSLQDAFKPYTLAAHLSNGILDGTEDPLSTKNFIVFEMDRICSGAKHSGDKRILGAVMMHLFRKIFKRLDGRPTLIIIDEAWIIDDPYFADTVRSLLKEIAKLNAWVALATQNLTDYFNSPLKDVIAEQCKTQVFLPSPLAKHGARQHYLDLGLTPEQIERVSRGQEQRDYFILQGQTFRRVELELCKVAGAFLLANSPAEQAQFGNLMRQDPVYGSARWLAQRGLEPWAEYLTRKIDAGRKEQYVQAVAV